MYYFLPSSHPFFFSLINASSRVCVCMRVCEFEQNWKNCACVRLYVWNRSRNHSDSVDVPLMLCLLTSALVFVLLSSPPHLLSSLLCSSHTHLFSLHLAIHPLMLYTSLKTLPSLMYVYAKFLSPSFPSLHLS